MALLPIILGLIVVLALWLLVLYNSLVARRSRVDEGWSDIDVQLKRRHDLIPNLVNTAKGYAEHERETLEAVIQARNAAVSAQEQNDPKQMATSENLLSGMLRQVFALSENYPALRANENFLHLQQELSDTENKIQAARRFYNGQVRDYSIAIARFPAVLIAGSLGFTKRDYFELNDASEREVPNVNF